MMAREDVAPWWFDFVEVGRVYRIIDGTATYFACVVSKDYHPNTVWTLRYTLHLDNGERVIQAGDGQLDRVVMEQVN